MSKGYGFGRFILIVLGVIGLMMILIGLVLIVWGIGQYSSQSLSNSGIWQIAAPLGFASAFFGLVGLTLAELGRAILDGSEAIQRAEIQLRKA
jgi:hypothetical protein